MDLARLLESSARSAADHLRGRRSRSGRVRLDRDFACFARGSRADPAASADGIVSRRCGDAVKIWQTSGRGCCQWARWQRTEGGRALIQHFRLKRDRHLPHPALAGLGVTRRKRARSRDGRTRPSSKCCVWTARASGPLPVRVQEALAGKVRAVARRASAVLISDYGLGAATPAMVRGLVRS